MNRTENRIENRMENRKVNRIAFLTALTIVIAGATVTARAARRRLRCDGRRCFDGA